jgi:RNA polymerase sigma-70 factor (ECF subfamily)
MVWLRSQSYSHRGEPEPASESDAELVARAKRGDGQAFALLYRRYLDQVYDYAAARLEGREAAEDATQTIFLRAVASITTCRDGTVFAGWLFAIARNVVTDAHRSRRYRMDPLADDLQVVDPGLSPEEAALCAEQRDELRQARERCLGPGEREIFDLRLQGLSDREIATALGRSHGAVRTAQYRLVQKLRECLGVVARAVGARYVDA